MDELWPTVLTTVKQLIDPQIYNVCLKNLRSGEKLGNGKLEIIANNDFLAEYVSKHYGKLLESIYQNESGKDIEFIFSNSSATIPSSYVAEPETSQSSSESYQQDTVLVDRYTFDSFIVGEGNAFAHASAVKVANTPAKLYNPLYIHGGVGLGKTHLLHAIAHQIQEQKPHLKIRLISSETFMTLFVDSIRKSTANQFKEQFRSIDILLVDDIQFFAGKTGTQVEFFHTFNALCGANKQIILASDSLPSEIEFLEERLRSRFAQGLVVDILPPNLDTRITILKKKARLEGIDLQDDVARLIASTVRNSVSELEGILIKIIALASMKEQDITMELVSNSI
jgi:chromosomal replication initiator protein